MDILWVFAQIFYPVANFKQFLYASKMALHLKTAYSNESLSIDLNNRQPVKFAYIFHEYN